MASFRHPLTSSVRGLTSSPCLCPSLFSVCLCLCLSVLCTRSIAGSTAILSFRQPPHSLTHFFSAIFPSFSTGSPSLRHFQTCDYRLLTTDYSTSLRVYRSCCAPEPRRGLPRVPESSDTRVTPIPPKLGTVCGIVAKRFSVAAIAVNSLRPRATHEQISLNSLGRYEIVLWQSP
jgi:hypothetical protein